MHHRLLGVLALGALAFFGCGSTDAAGEIVNTDAVEGGAGQKGSDAASVVVDVGSGAADVSAEPSPADAVSADVGSAQDVDATEAPDETSACGPMAACSGYDDTQRPFIECLVPNHLVAGKMASLRVLGSYLATGPMMPAIITIDDVALNGEPVSSCELMVTVPAGAVTKVKQAPVIVSPGGRSGQSNTVPIDVTAM
jgi:hypothetical protein